MNENYKVIEIKRIVKGDNIYFIEPQLNKWIFFKYPALKNELTEEITKIKVSSDFITEKGTTLFYNSKYLNIEKEKQKNDII